VARAEFGGRRTGCCSFGNGTDVFSVFGTYIMEEYFLFVGLVRFFVCPINFLMWLLGDTQSKKGCG